MAAADPRQPGKKRRVLAPWAAVAAVLALCAGCYAGGPFLTLWRLSQALDCGDVAALDALVDWDAVRQGLKDDIAEGVIGMSQQALEDSNTLPPFGASFVSGIAGSEVDHAVTPQGLLHVTRSLDQPPPGPIALAAPPFPAAAFPAIVAAGFSAPTEFDLRLRAACQDAAEPPLHVRLAFRAGRWRVVRIWVPQDLMDRASSRT